MRNQQVELRDHPLNVRERIRVVAVGMVSPGRQREDDRTNYCRKTQAESHAPPPDWFVEPCIQNDSSQPHSGGFRSTGGGTGNPLE